MLLMNWQVQNQLSRKNAGHESDYYIESNFYWNLNWNEVESKFLIPFQKHPKSNAQVSYLCFLSFLRFTPIRSDLTLIRMKSTGCINTSKILWEPSSLLKEHLKQNSSGKHRIFSKSHLILSVIPILLSCTSTT